MADPVAFTGSSTINFFVGGHGGHLWGSAVALVHAPNKWSDLLCNGRWCRMFNLCFMGWFPVTAGDISKSYVEHSIASRQFDIDDIGVLRRPCHGFGTFNCHC